MIGIDSINSSHKTHLSVSATGDDLVYVWVVAHRPEQRVGDHHLKTHKPPAAGNLEEKDDDRTERVTFTNVLVVTVVVV